MSVPTFNVLGIRVSALSLDAATNALVAARGSPAGGHVCLATAHGVVEARRDPTVRAAFHRARFVTPDGMPLVWLGRWHGHRAITRVYGPDLLLATCAAGRATGLRHFFLGGRAGVAEALAGRLGARFPGLAVAGTFTPPFRPLAPEEFAEMRTWVRNRQPDLIWVGLGSPKQELFMAEAAPHFPGTLFIGVGAAFDFLSGRVRQAPRWMQRGGLEWLFRLATEPRRLGRRYLVNGPRFATQALAQLTGLVRYPSD